MLHGAHCRAPPPRRRHRTTPPARPLAISFFAGHLMLSAAYACASTPYTERSRKKVVYQNTACLKPGLDFARQLDDIIIISI